MIGSLRGCLAAKRAPIIVLDCNGVGYEVETPMSTFLELPAVGEQLFIHTHLHVREDAQMLFGFASLEERALFRSLLKISGIGARLALAILSAMSEADFRRCIEYEDSASLVRIPGVGKKTAERLIIEMRDKFSHPLTRAPVAGGTAANPKTEAVDALVSLGYKLGEVNRLIGTMDLDGKSAEDIIRQALRQAAR
ncbi:MAG: Holliday junction branch migration protein RuvA [Gammaproteobacteria bacterium]|nr:Holliday junction branch migration protein RuvA [Gammaproteobacteria bacterium]MDH5303671.1 Holliday junction branch migration protein RuvA [Gammaproteobacteria bacterium]MDH5323388.1 Holliday junction branch migration protein RuvA [Gammaproteobacteria bacterium]